MQHIIMSFDRHSFIFGVCGLILIPFALLKNYLEFINDLTKQNIIKINVCSNKNYCLV